MLTVLTSIFTAVIGWVTTALGVITGNDFLLVFVVLGIASLVVGMVLTLIKGLRK